MYNNFNIKEFIIPFHLEEKRNLSIFLSFALILLTLLILQLSYYIVKFNLIDSSKRLYLKYLIDLVFSQRIVFK